MKPPPKPTFGTLAVPLASAPNENLFAPPPPKMPPAGVATVVVVVDDVVVGGVGGTGGTSTRLANGDGFTADDSVVAGFGTPNENGALAVPAVDEVVVAGTCGFGAKPANGDGFTWVESAVAGFG